MIKVILADDHPIMKEGIKSVLQRQDDIRVVDEFENGVDLVKKINKKNFDILVLDLSLPGKSGLEVLKEIQPLSPRLPVLILSVHPEEQYAVRVLKAGASGYMTKECIPERLIYAIRKIHKGGIYVSESMSERLPFILKGSSSKAVSDILSDREFEIFLLIASGQTPSEIGEKLNLSVKTVSTHRFHIMDKLELKTNSDLTRYAIRNGLIEP